MSAATDQNVLRHQALRRLGALAHQTRASLRAADRFVTQGGTPDTETASWLVCTAVDLAHEVAEELDNLARGLREAGSDAVRLQALAPWRRNAHQLHAACRAADVFLEQETRDDQDTGTWLVASARTLADRLAAALDDGIGAWPGADANRRPAAQVIRSVS